jgi:hypothetical protein
MFDSTTMIQATLVLPTALLVVLDLHGVFDQLDPSRHGILRSVYGCIFLVCLFVAFWLVPRVYEALAPAILERWARVRAKGRTRFVWLHGVLGWGGTFALGLAIFSTIPRVLLNKASVADFPITLAIAAFFLSLAGYEKGRRTWKKRERAFLAAKDQDRV